MVACCR